jgi:hypothetical protein
MPSRVLWKVFLSLTVSSALILPAIAEQTEQNTQSDRSTNAVRQNDDTGRLRGNAHDNGVYLPPLCTQHPNIPLCPGNKASPAARNRQ